jgi:type I restriction enzyme S subunit
MVPANSVIVALAGQGKTRGSVAITRISLCTNQSLCSILPNETYDSDYLYFFLKNQYETLRFISSGDGTRGGLNLQMLRDFLIPVPSLEEQQKIAECLSSIESYISSINEKVEQLKAHKKSLLQKLFPQRGQTVPEYRFSEFQKDSAWEKMKLGDVTTVINRRNKSNRSLPIYSISNKDGFVLQSEQFDGLDSESRGYDISLYKIVGRNTFAYNPARINIGSIGYSGNLKEVLISSLYVCFKTTDELDDEFLICFLKTAQFSQAVENNVEGGIRSYLFYENFSRINISIPSLQEQKKIASTILSIDDVISKYTDKVSLLEDYKKGLMQQLFPAITK